MTHWPFVSVIVVNFNGKRYLGDCLESLAKQTYPRSRFEVIVVDNASCDGSVEFVKRHFPSIRIIEAGKNIGFAAGNNLGIRQSTGDWIALLNNDAVAEPNWLTTAVEAGETTGVGGVASHIVFQERPDWVNSTGLVVLPDGRGADRDFGKRNAEVQRPRGEVFGGCGAAVLLRRTMLDDVGLFDPKLFMYYEDLELAWRARKHGWRFIYEPTARVRHKFGASAGVASPLQLRFVERNRCLVNLRHAPLPIAIGTVLGAVARLGRTMWQCMFGKSITGRHVGAHALAIASVAGLLPIIAWQRMASRCRFGQRPDSELLRWMNGEFGLSKPVPRREGFVARRAG